MRTKHCLNHNIKSVPLVLTGTTLGSRRVCCTFNRSNMLDGFTIDSERGLWVTALVSNRLWYVPAGGAPRLLIEDCEARHLHDLRAAIAQDDGVGREFLYEERVSTLKNVSSITFGGEDLKTAYLGNLCDDAIYKLQLPVAGIKPAHWHLDEKAPGQAPIYLSSPTSASSVG
jgi:hypothetical protein